MATQRHWSLGIGTYDDDAVGTIPGQLELLRALSELRGKDVALLFRLRGQREHDEDDINAIFDLSCLSAQNSTLSPEEVTSLLTMSRVAFLPGYNLHHAPGETTRTRSRYHLRLIPDLGESQLPIKADWSPVVDLVRARGQELSIEMCCRTIGTEQFSQMRNIMPFTTGRDSATPTFESAATQSVGHAYQPIAYTVMIHSRESIDPVFACALGRLILGVPVTARETARVQYFGKRQPGTIIGSPEELIRSWHAPYGNIQGRGLGNRKVTRMPIRFKKSLIDDGIAIGTAVSIGPQADERIQIRSSTADRSKHVYIIGKTGSGKTNLLKNIALQDIHAGHGVAAIDPHGDLCDYIVRNVGDRVDDVTLLDFSDPDSLPVLNPLTLDVHSELDYKLAVEELLEIIVRRSFNTFTGPVFDDTTRMMFYTIAHQVVRGAAEPSIPLAIEIIRTAKMRNWVRKALRSTDPELSEQWETFEGMLASSISEHARWVAAKFADFANGSPLQAICGAGGSPLSIDAIYKEGKILLVKLPETGMGHSATQFIGSLIFTRLYRAARKANQTERPFFIHVDEFQRFVGHELEELVAEARKFNICLTFAHQNLRQLESFSRYEGSASSRLAEAIFSNVGSIIAMRTSGRDVSTIASEFNVSEAAVRDIAQYQALTRASIGGSEQSVFTLHIPHAVSSGEMTTVKSIRKRMVADGLWRSSKQLAEVDNALETFRKSPSMPILDRSADRTDNSTERDEAGSSRGGSSYLDDWLERRRSSSEANALTATALSQDSESTTNVAEESAND